jgi:hypothetical protein
MAEKLDIAPIPVELADMLTSPAGPVVRYDHLISLAGRLRRLGMDYDAIVAELQAANQNFPSPLDPGEVESVAQSIMRYPRSLDI